MESKIIGILNKYKCSPTETWITNDIITEQDFEKISKEITDVYNYGINNNREAASNVLDSNMSDFTRKHIDKVHYLDGWLIDAMVQYKAEETHRDGSIAVIEKPKFPPNREKPTNGLQKLLLWIDERREAIKAEEKIYHMNWPKDGLLENLPNNLQKDKNLHNRHTIAELNKTGRECVERVEACVQNNEKHNESLRDKDKIIESLEREVKKLNAIIKENL